MARVGARGWPVAMHFTPTEVVARCVEEYRAALARRAEPAGHGSVSAAARCSAARPTSPRRPEVARAEGALALQGFWHLSSLAAPPPPAEFSDDAAQGADEPRLGRTDLRRARRASAAC